MKTHPKFPLFLHLIFGLLSFFIILDFAIPGKTISAELIDVKRERQQYYNAAGNHHYSYKAITPKHSFWVDKDFAALDWANQKVQYNLSPIFKEVNHYCLLGLSNSSYHSLRIASALLVPLLVLISIFITYRYRRKMDILFFILQTLLLIDLIFLAL